MTTTPICSASRTNISQRAGLALVGAVWMLLAAGAQAHEMSQQAVRYEDLDLTRSADTQALYRRLRVAAGRVCAALESRDLRRQSLHRACVADALNKAVADVNDATLTALHQSDRTLRVVQDAAAKSRS